MLVYVATQVVANLIVQILANAASAGVNGYTAYSIAWQFFQLPYAIVGISVITALLPRMSEHASVRRYSLVRDDFSIGVRLASVLVVQAVGLPGSCSAGRWPSSWSPTAAAGPAAARYIGEVFGLFAIGLVPYMLTQLQLRVFYSFQDSRTAALVGLLTMIHQHRGRTGSRESGAAGRRCGGRAGRRVRRGQPGRGERPGGPCCYGGWAAWTAGLSPGA